MTFGVNRGFSIGDQRSSVRRSFEATTTGTDGRPPIRIVEGAAVGLAEREAVNDGPLQGEIILCQTDDGRTRVECRFADDSIWLTQRMFSDLYQKDVRTINEHLQNICADGELSPEATIREFRIVRMEGSREVARVVDHYRLEAIPAVGYRVRSARGTAFRQWATVRLAECLVKGFVRTTSA